MTQRRAADSAVGERIRTRRLLRGWRMRYAASRAGVLHAPWSRIERGLQGVGNRFMLADIARALECSPADLAGAESPSRERATTATHAGVLGLRRALVDIDLTESSHRSAPAMADLAPATRCCAGTRRTRWPGRFADLPIAESLRVTAVPVSAWRSDRLLPAGPAH